MCSYYGMFPAKVAHYFIQKYSDVGDLVVDPFSGRGTTALQARLEGRRAFANDLNPLAFVLSSAKIAPPTWSSIGAFVDDLERQYLGTGYRNLDVNPDIKMLYHDNTLRQLVFLRERLLSKALTAWGSHEFMVAGALAGIMHGGHRRDGTSSYLSISMPNTFSMSPTYVAKFIAENDLTKPDQDVFEKLRDKLARLYLDDLAGPDGRATNDDAVSVMSGEQIGPGEADLIVTSPPYLRVVNYGASNWIRLWLFGFDEVARDQGEGRKRLDAALDHGHGYDTYKRFILRVLQGVERTLKRDGVGVMVIGDVAEPGKDAVPLAATVWGDVEGETGLRLLDLIEDDLPSQSKVSRIWGDTRGQATNRDCALVVTHRDGDPDLSRTVDWSEPYRDAGPDDAHERLRGQRPR
jgi:site-specific DNA-methyltransferase (adenine-specific)